MNKNNRSGEERKKMIEKATSQFADLDEIDKAYISGYVSGKQEERQKWAQSNEDKKVML